MSESATHLSTKVSISSGYRVDVTFAARKRIAFTTLARPPARSMPVAEAKRLSGPVMYVRMVHLPPRAVRREKFRRHSTGLWLREVVALCEFAPHLSQPRQLFGGLHTLGHDLQAQAVSQAHYPRHQRGIVGVLPKPADERAVILR